MAGGKNKRHPHVELEVTVGHETRHIRKAAGIYTGLEQRRKIKVRHTDLNVVKHRCELRL